MKIKLNLLFVLLFTIIITNAQHPPKGSVAYYESMRIAYQTKIDWVNSNFKEKALAEESNWFEIANANVQKMTKNKALPKDSENSKYLPSFDRSLNDEPDIFESGICSGALQFSLDGYPYTFPCQFDYGYAEEGPDYGCVLNAINPRWLFMKVTGSGELLMELSANQDIDFVLWGPFDCPVCDPYSLSEENIIDCSYSLANQETPEIGPNSSEGSYTAIADKWYMMVVINFSGSIQDFTINKIGGTATVNSGWVESGHAIAQPIFEVAESIICEGDEVVYSVVNDTNLTYNWLLPDGWEEENITNNSISVTNNGNNGTISVFAEGSCGTSSLQSIDITVNSTNYQPSFYNFVNPTCENATRYFSVDSVPGNTYYWEYTDGWSSEGRGVNISVGDTGGVITVTPINSCGTGVPLIQSINTVGPVGEIEFLIGEVDVCEGDTQIYHTYAEDAYSYLWYKPEGWSTSGYISPDTLSLIIGEANDSIMVRPTNNCGIGGSENITITVNSLPISNFEFTYSQSEVTFNNSSQNSDSYSWDFGDGESSAETNPVHEYVNDGAYTIILTAYNNCGNTYYENTVSINSIGIPQVNLVNFNISPNPAKNKISVVFEKNQSGTLQIYNLAGHLLLEESYRDKIELEIFVKDLEKGVYIIKIGAEIQKLIIE